MNGLPKITAHLFGFVVLPNGDRQHAGTENEADGFCTHIKMERPGDKGEPFDVLAEKGHETLDDAIGRAEALALMLHSNANQWCHD